jgi:hypothetical protein
VDRVLETVSTFVGLEGIILNVRFNRVWYEDMSSGMWRIVVWLRITDVSGQFLRVLPLPLTS